MRRKKLGDFNEGGFFKGTVAERTGEKRGRESKYGDASCVRYDGNDRNVEWTRESRQ